MNVKWKQVLRRRADLDFGYQILSHPGGDPEANLKSVSDRCYLREVTFEWELTKVTICLPLDCLQGGFWYQISGM